MKKLITTLFIMCLFMCMFTSIAFGENISESASIDESLDEKIEETMDIINEIDSSDMMLLENGDKLFHRVYTLGEGYTLVVDLKDCDESALCESTCSLMSAATSGNNKGWKKYGKRFFSATASIKYSGETVKIKLENHYILSAKGIDENYGKASCVSSMNTISISKGTPMITDSVARTAGSSDVNMNCDFSVKTCTAEGK